MKKNRITELVKFNVLSTTTEEQLLEKAEAFNKFQQKQEGFIDAEIVKNISDSGWCLIYHFDSMEKVKAIGEKLRSSEEFAAFTTLLMPGSLAVSMHQQVKEW